LVGFALNGATLHEKIVDTRVNFFAPSLERSVERERVERRLTAILMADVVGYSRLMGADDEATLAQLKAHQDALVAPKIKEHRGRIVRTMGDGLLVVFASVVDALRCAVEVQCGMAGRNAQVPPERRIELRIGINFGDIIIDGRDVHGDGVNVTARLENLAEPGGICVSGRVQEDAQGKLDIAFEDIGEQQLKNIPRSVRVYRVKPAQPVANAAATIQSGLPLPDKPSIAVLPFQNMSGDSEQDYFADGVVEEIITALSRFRELFVIARNSSFTYKNRAVDVKQVGRELGVRYVLEGSVRKAANRVRITVQLIDAIGGIHLWADRIEGTFEDIFELQDRVTENVVGAIAPKIEQAEIERTKHKPTDSLDAYDCYLRAMMYFHQWTSESISEALRLFYKAIELDPSFASAHGLAAWCYVRRRLSGWMKDPLQEMAELERLARRAGELANDDTVALYSAGWALVQVSGYAEAGGAMIDRALTLNPNITDAWTLGGWTKIYLGEPDKAIEYFRRAIRLNPLDRLIARMQTGVAAAQFLAGRYKEAALSAQSALLQHPNDQPLLRVAAASHALAGQVTDAQRSIERIRHLNPGLGLSRVAELAPCRRPEDVSRYVDGLRKAGLPE
jgi:TolB-like protein/class 3 adenylate cyclase/Tfp pilus assembly protein PilF